MNAQSEKLTLAIAERLQAAMDNLMDVRRLMREGGDDDVERSNAVLQATCDVIRLRDCVIKTLVGD